jgi:putative transposase
MARLSCTLRQLLQGAGTVCALLLDAPRCLQLWLRPSAALAVENLFLRTQLALYQARKVKPQRATDPTRFTLVWLAQWFDWQPALVVGQPETFQRWRRQRYKLFWRSTSGPGRPPIPGELQALIRQMAHGTLTCSDSRT